MKNPLYRLIGFILSRKCVYTRLEAIAMRNPDTPILSPDGTEVYMHRGWLFNKITDGKRKYPWIDYSARVHRIMMPDLDRDKHDHPWKARTFIMHNGYDEQRMIDVRDHDGNAVSFKGGHITHIDSSVTYRRVAGDTSTLGYEQYHKITRLHNNAEGALTLFVFGKYEGDWGFMVNGTKMARRDYDLMHGKQFKQYAEVAIATLYPPVPERPTRMELKPLPAGTPNEVSEKRLRMYDLFGQVKDKFGAPVARQMIREHVDGRIGNAKLADITPLMYDTAIKACELKLKYGQVKGVNINPEPSTPRPPPPKAPPKPRS